MKKLKLHKETLRTLRPDHLSKVEGGMGLKPSLMSCEVTCVGCLDTMQQCSGPK